MSEFELRIIVLNKKMVYFFEHEKCLFALVEVLGRLISDEVAGVGLLEAINDRPDICDIFYFFTAITLKFHFSRFFCFGDGFSDIHFDDFKIFDIDEIFLFHDL